MFFSRRNWLIEEVEMKSLPGCSFPFVQRLGRKGFLIIFLNIVLHLDSSINFLFLFFQLTNYLRR